MPYDTGEYFDHDGTCNQVTYTAAGNNMSLSGVSHIECHLCHSVSVSQCHNVTMFDGV